MAPAEKVRNSDPPPSLFPPFPPPKTIEFWSIPVSPVNEMLVIVHNWALKNPSPFFKKYYLRILYSICDRKTNTPHPSLLT